MSQYGGRSNDGNDHYEPLEPICSQFLTSNLIADAFGYSGPSSLKFADSCGYFNGPDHPLTLNLHYKMFCASVGLGYTKNELRPLEIGRRIYIFNATSIDGHRSTNRETASLLYRAALISFFCRELNNPVHIPMLNAETYATVVGANSEIFGGKDTWIPTAVDAKINIAEISCRML